ncbi:VanZ family protein [uncultured Winogradskyella sp.]|uniref:VanZ family protein n=1 Tax=uncultured Winogradskyella sp. TaxID=395353 RepID=UPI002617A2B6|nr:VanZ family protein [uncultured Winogradskyella sp.]
MITKHLLVLKNSKFYLVIAVAYTFILLYFTLGNPDEVLPETNIKFQDKIFHFIAYITLAILWGLYFFTGHYKKGLLISFIATLIFGVVLELVQEVINPLRNYDNLDLLANCVGVVVGTIVVLYYKNLKLK